MGMGDRIRELRIKNNFTQEELAEKLGLQKSAIATRKHVVLNYLN